MNIASAESIISILCLFFAYCFSVTLTGAGQAYIARKMGDDTAAQDGFLSLNPADHIDPIGAFMLVLFRFGWGRTITINPFNIKQSWHGLRVFLVYSTEALLSMLIAISALFILVLGFKKSALYLAFEMFFSGYAPTRLLAKTFPEISSLSMVMALLLVSVVFFNIFITTYSIVINSVKYIIARGYQHGHQYIEYADYILIFAPLIFLFLFAQQLSMLVMQIILLSAGGLGHFLGFIDLLQ